MAISILIVDNDEITRDVLARLVAFRLPNAILHVTAVFANALELCTKLKVDIVITTTTMPPGSSDSMLHSIRAIPYDPVKIIIMTSSSGYARHEVTDRQTVYNAPNTHLIPKPINLDDLINSIQERIKEVEADRLSKPASHD